VARHRAPVTPIVAELVPLREHLAEVDVWREKFASERDRRYTEVSIEREKALKIKEVADLAALQLAREIQTYKDEKANELREQISSERGLYASKEDVANLAAKVDALLKPLNDYVSANRGGDNKATDLRAWLPIVIALAALLVVVFRP
jgi:hypothetical protein